MTHRRMGVRPARFLGVEGVGRALFLPMLSVRQPLSHEFRNAIFLCTVVSCPMLLFLQAPCP